MPRDGRKDRRQPTPQLVAALADMQAYLDRRAANRNAYAARCREAREAAQRHAIRRNVAASINRARNQQRKEAAE